MDNGFWFAPIKAGPARSCLRRAGRWHRPGLGGRCMYPESRLRSRSATGRLLYDLDRDAYTFGDCYPVKTPPAPKPLGNALRPSRPRRLSRRVRRTTGYSRADFFWYLA